MIEGYKLFNKGLKNRYNIPFKENSTYEVDTTINELSYGNHGNGLHFVKRLEDGLRYFDAMNNDIDIAQVVALGKVKESYDDYYGYYDLYVTDKLKIKHILTRKEIIDYALSLNEKGIIRFVAGLKLTKEEQKIIRNSFQNKNVEMAIEYYQKNNKEIYELNNKILVYRNQ